MIDSYSNIFTTELLNEIKDMIINQKNDAALRALSIDNQIKLWNTSIFRTLNNAAYISKNKELKVTGDVQLTDLIRVIPTIKNSRSTMKLIKERIENVETCNELVDLINFYIKTTSKFDEKLFFKTKTKLLINYFDMNSILKLYSESFQLILSLLSKRDALKFFKEIVVTNLPYCSDKEKIFDMLNQIDQKYPQSLDLTSLVTFWLSKESKFSPNGITYLINDYSSSKGNNAFIRDYLKTYLNQNLQLDDLHAFTIQLRKYKIESSELAFKLIESLNYQFERLLSLDLSISRQIIHRLYNEEEYLYGIIEKKLASNYGCHKFKEYDLMERVDINKYVKKKLVNNAQFLNALKTNSKASVYCYTNIHRLINEHGRDLARSLSENYLIAVQLNQYFQIKFNKYNYTPLDFQFDMNNVTIENNKGYFDYFMNL